VQAKIDALKTARNGADKSALETAVQELNQAMSAIGEAMQKNQEPPKPAEGGETKAE
jgi:hypothetical protein